MLKQQLSARRSIRQEDLHAHRITHTIRDAPLLFIAPVQRVTDVFRQRLDEVETLHHVGIRQRRRIRQRHRPPYGALEMLCAGK